MKRPRRLKPCKYGPTFGKIDWQLLKVDSGTPTTCKYHGASFSSFDAFKRCCVLRQKSHNGPNIIAKLNKPHECLNCKCGQEILAGRRKTLPENVKKTQKTTADFNTIMRVNRANKMGDLLK